MHKALAYANDLADHDDIEDDCELVFGSHSGNRNGVVPPIRYIGSSNSFKVRRWAFAGRIEVA